MLKGDKSWRRDYRCVFIACPVQSLETVTLTCFTLAGCQWPIDGSICHKEIFKKWERYVLK
jgi:hypothetical protein